MKFLEPLPSQADRALLRNFAIFFLVMVVFTSGLIYLLIAAEYQINKANSLVAHTHRVIIQAEKLSALVESMLSAQRGYFVSGADKLFDEYKFKRQTLSDHIARLNQLTKGNLSQASRANELQNNFTEFTSKLDEEQKNRSGRAPKIAAEDLTRAEDLRSNILRVNDMLLKEEYSLLNERTRALETKKEKYFNTLLTGIIVASTLLLLFNGFLLNAQRKRMRIEVSLKDTEERFTLAVEGARDGIFDWNIITGRVFYSSQFFRMLGYKQGSFTGSIDDFKTLIHPEDEQKVMEYIKYYLEHKISEYSQEFRMVTEDGKSMWINARGQAIFDSKGNALRLVGAHTDITYLKDYQHHLRTEKNQAEAANRAKSDFLAHMSHEIRTPLTAISGIAEIFEKNQAAIDEKHRKLVKTLYSSTSALKDLVNDILDFSKIESGELELDVTSFRIQSLFEEVTSMMAVRATHKNVNFIFDYADLHDIDFQGDKSRLRQILVNLTGNALKFTNSGGSITVKAHFESRNNQDYIRIDVADTGIGIAVENFDLIFERFKQADPSVSRKYGGTGLGLSISRNLARLMGGEIILSSTLGEGSTFSLLLPARDTGLLQEADDSKDLNKSLNDRIQQSLRGESKILIVEDYEGNIQVISHILEEIGCSFDIARTGVQALKFWKDRHYDIILMDIQMPEMDGFTATQEIRRLEKDSHYPSIPIIGMTAHALLGDKDKCIAAGMDAYLPKPIVEIDLKRQLLRFLGQKNRAV